MVDYNIWHTKPYKGISFLGLVETHYLAWFQASATAQMKSSLFWTVTRRCFKINNRRYILYYVTLCYTNIGPGSSVGIATELRAGRSGIEFRWERDFPPVQTGPGAHPASCKMGTLSFPGVKCGRGVLLTPHPLLVLRSLESGAILYPPSGTHRTYNGITVPYTNVTNTLTVPIRVEFEAGWAPESVSTI